MTLSGALPALVSLLALPSAAQDVPPAGPPELIAVGSAEVDPGRCAGRAPAPAAPAAGGPVFDLKAHPEFAGEMEGWKLIGWKPDAAGSRVLAADGKPVTEAYLSWMHQPMDFSGERIDPSLWEGLQLRGYALDEKTCRLKSPQGGELTRLELEESNAMTRRGLEHMALENMKVLLAGAKGSAPVPKEVLDRVQALASAGVKLPPGVQALFAKGRVPTAAEFSGAVDKAYAASTRFFDGSRTLQELGGAALPPVAGVNVPEKPRAYRGPEEQRLGELLGGELTARFQRNEAGRELLSRFRDAKGVLRLPEITVLKLTQAPDDPNQPGAVENPENGAVAVNHWEVERYLLAQFPPAERAARAKEFADPAALRRFLEKDPAARARLLDSLDEVIFHEMVHSWQTRRSSYDIELARGNVPSANPLVKEFEAHREQCRYALEKAAADPSALSRSGYSDHCLEMVRSYRDFRNGITSQYMSGFVGSQLLPEVAARQRVRESAARSLMGGGLYEKVLQTLKLAGFARGDAAIKSLQEEYDRSDGRFLDRTLPGLRARLASDLPKAALRAGRPDVALRVLASMPPDQKLPDGLRARLADKTAALLIRPPASLELDDRVRAFSALGVALKAENKPWSPELTKAYARDAAAQASVLADAAEQQARPEVRRQYLAAAKGWAAYSAVDDPVRARIAKLLPADAKPGKNP